MKTNIEENECYKYVALGISRFNKIIENCWISIVFGHLGYIFVFST